MVITIFSSMLYVLLKQVMTNSKSFETVCRITALFLMAFLLSCHVYFCILIFTDNNDFLDNGRSKKSIII